MPTFKNQTIVVPFDFSNSSINAFRQVQQWADESNTIHMVYVVEPNMVMIDVNPPMWMPPNLDNDTRELMLERMREEYCFDNVNHHALIGDPGTLIVEVAKEEKADVIVMPSHGRSGLSRLFLGSVAERVLRLSECPVYILRGAKFESEEAPFIQASRANVN